MEKHPIALKNQIYILPGDAVSGDELGEVNYLYTFCRFWNEYEGTDFSEDEFIFIKASGPNNFSVHPTTGMIYVANLVGLTGDVSIVVRVSIRRMHLDVICRIIYIPVEDCVYFDSGYAGDNGTSNGTRSRPFVKFNRSALGTGTPGKTYLYKRGTVTSDQSAQFISPKVGGRYPDYINVCGWGQGPRPVFTDTGSNNRTFTVGGQPWGNNPPDPSLACHNFRMMDIETYKEVADSWYPILIKPVGDNIHITRYKGTNTLFDHGIVYLPAMTNDVQGSEHRNILLENFELRNALSRGIKVETSGVLCQNFKCKNDNSLGPTGSPAPTCAHKPNVHFYYIDVEVENISAGNLGFQARASNVVHKWIWAKGLRYVMTPFVHNANSGWGPEYLIDGTCSYKHVIIENCFQAAYFGRHAGTLDVADGLTFSNIHIKSAQHGIQITEGAKNVTVSYSDLSNCSAGSGFRVFEKAGSGNKLHNCTVLNNKIQDIRLNRDDIEIINCLYGVINGAANAAITRSTHFRTTANLKGKGIDLGYEVDLYGNPVANPPSIGAVEYTRASVDPRDSTESSGSD